MAPCRYLNQCWDIVNRTLGNKLKWNFSRDSYIIINKCSVKCRPFCLGLNVLKCTYAEDPDTHWKTPLWSDDAIRQHRSVSNLTQLMVWYMMAFCHCLNQWWHIIYSRLSCDVHFGAPSSEALMNLNLTPDMYSQIIFLKLLSHFSGNNELLSAITYT